MSIFQGNSPHPRTARSGLLATVLFAASVLAGSGAPDEGALARLWRLHHEQPDAHAVIADACLLWVQRAPRDPLAPVARGLASWHWLRLERYADAREALAAPGIPDPTDPPLTRAAHEISRAWISRLDRETVLAALRHYYARQAAFPASLDVLATLPPERRPPLHDAWGTPWRYSLRGFRFLAGIDDQRTTLESAHLGRRHSDLKEVLARPYAHDIPFEAERRVGPAGPGQAISFRAVGEATPMTPTAPIVSVPGSRFEDVTFVFMGDTLIVLASRDYWKVLPKP